MNPIITTAPNLVPAYAEVFILIAASAILLIDMFLKDEKRTVTYLLSLATLVGAAVISFADYNAGTTAYTFNNMYVSDPMGNLLKLFTYLTVGITLVYSRHYAGQRGMMSGNLSGEFYVLALFSMLGQMIMIAANSMLSIYLGLELMSLSLYALVALRRDHSISTEAAMKYFVLGALASGFLLYGISMIYGATGSLNIQQVLAQASSVTSNSTVLVFGLVFVVAGLAFKLGAVPFHMWVPDVYQGSPTAVTLLLGGAPKLASFAIALRILYEALNPMAAEWQQMLVILAVLSLVIGNLTAIAQTNLKRMLAYSTIAQIGFVLLALAAGAAQTQGTDGKLVLDFANAPAAYGAAMYYSITYVLTTLGTFGVIMMLSRAGFEADNLADFRGLSKRSPWFALIMTALLFSLAGVPPMMGFMAKLSVLQVVVQNGQTWLALIAVLFSLIGAYYYLRVVKVMWFDEPVDTAVVYAPLDMRIVMSLNGILVLVLGIVPGALLDACARAIKATMQF